MIDKVDADFANAARENARDSRVAAQTDGLKYDANKPPLGLLPRVALDETAKVLAYGAKKYATHNWRKGIGHQRLVNAALRHIYAWNEGEDNDPESGLSHLAHALCCLSFAITEHATHPELDDRYKPAQVTK